MWYLNPKNILLMVLTVVVVVVGFLYLWQRNTVVKQAGQIDALTITNAGLNAQITEYQTTIANAKKTQAQQQKITNDAASLMASVNKIKETKCIRSEDEKIISNIVYFFNSRGLLKTGNPKSDGEVLPVTDTTDVTGWTIKQVIANQLILTDYVLQLEKTRDCYEQK